MNLAHRGMVVDTKCRCKQADQETSWHALWVCTQLENLREDWSVMPKVVYCSGENVLGFLDGWSVRIDRNMFCILCVALWRAWFLRNSLVHDPSGHADGDILSWATNFVSEFHVGNNNIVRANSQPTVNINIWIPPDPGVFKPKCDVAIDKQMGTNHFHTQIKQNKTSNKPFLQSN